MCNNAYSSADFQLAPISYANICFLLLPLNHNLENGIIKQETGN